MYRYAVLVRIGTIVTKLDPLPIADARTRLFLF